MRRGQRIRDYELIRSLGAGGMGEVWLASQEGLLNREVAIKCLPDAYYSDRNLRSRFERESKVQAKLEHARIVPAYDGFEDGGRLYLVMPVIRGTSLEELIKSASLPDVTHLEKWFRGLLEALAYVHGRRVFHRDIKPSNIMVTNDLDVRLIDFGIAQSKELEQSNLTATGQRIGTFNYMSPEQAEGESLDERSDLYSLALTMLVAWTGSLPKGDREIKKAISTHVPRHLRSVLSKCLERDRTARYSRAADVLESMSSGWHRRRFPVLLGGAAMLILVVVLVVQTMGRSPISTEMVSVPAGYFVSGMHRSQIPLELAAYNLDAVVDRGVSREWIKRFKIDKFEVSNEDFAEFVQAVGYRAPEHWKSSVPSEEIANLPVVNVSAADARAFARWAKKRLPTADEWEKAARGPNGNLYPWGATYSAGGANTEEAGLGAPCAVAVYGSDVSEYALVGMGGNVMEWTSSDYAPDDPDDRYRVICGGSFDEFGAVASLAAFRRGANSTARRYDIGFRCAK